MSSDNQIGDQFTTEIDMSTEQLRQQILQQMLPSDDIKHEKTSTSTILSQEPIESEEIEDEDKHQKKLQLYREYHKQYMNKETPDQRGKRLEYQKMYRMKQRGISTDGSNTPGKSESEDSQSQPILSQEEIEMTEAQRLKYREYHRQYRSAMTPEQRKRIAEYQKKYREDKQAQRLANEATEFGPDGTPRRRARKKTGDAAATPNSPAVTFFGTKISAKDLTNIAQIHDEETRNFVKNLRKNGEFLNRLALYFSIDSSLQITANDNFIQRINIFNFFNFITSKGGIANMGEDGWKEYCESMEYPESFAERLRDLYTHLMQDFEKVEQELALVKKASNPNGSKNDAPTDEDEEDGDYADLKRANSQTLDATVNRTIRKRRQSSSGAQNQVSLKENDPNLDEAVRIASDDFAKELISIWMREPGFIPEKASQWNSHELFVFYKETISRGGYEKVNDEMKWPEISYIMNPIRKTTPRGPFYRIFYKNYLLPYELESQKKFATTTSNTTADGDTNPKSPSVDPTDENGVENRPLKKRKLLESEATAATGASISSGELIDVQDAIFDISNINSDEVIDPTQVLKGIAETH